MSRSNRNIGQALFSLAALVMLVAGIYAVANLPTVTPEEAARNREKSLASARQRNVVRLIALRRYMKDTHTTPPTCYLYMTTGSMETIVTGPVDCAAIPADLLDVPETVQQ